MEIKKVIHYLILIFLRLLNILSFGWVHRSYYNDDFYKYKNKDVIGARKLIGAAYLLKANDLNTLILSFKILDESNQREKGIELLKRAYRLYPRDPDVLFHLGDLEQQSGNTEKAMEYYKSSLKENPNVDGALNNMGILYLEKLNNPYKAFEMFQKALTLQPVSGQFLYNMGNCLSALDRDEEALEYYKKAFKLEPNNPSIIFNYANLNNELEHYEEAIQALEKLIQLSPSNSKAYYLLDESYFETGRVKEAETALIEAMVRGDKDAEILLKEIRE